MGARQHTWAPTTYHYLDHHHRRRRSSSVSLSTTSSSSSTNTTTTTTTTNGKRFRRRCTYPISYQRKAISPRVCYFARPVTISSSSSSENTMQHQLSIEIPATYLSSSSPACSSPVPVFHTQSLLFLFGFLFFPCWWVGAFLLRKQPQQQPSLLPTKEGYQAHYNLISVHPSLLANGRISSRVLWVPQQQHYSSNSTLRVVSTSLPDIPGSRTSWARRLEQEYEMFQKWNRYMSFASIVLILIIVAMLAWYHGGVVYGRWRPLLPH
ncbi:hypothetical protein O0I10_010967 [Lichtheimia ornata]|uniref:Transmembrane protein n=1 Tax=Lichtheimia ornata TaxID=688661 RepID=A0AAD7XUL2_9FUNG|nr:uncharacterized protein O0I10_010967 [Lichtheimia ornata]KAJ8653421.1 hypothetical protein O0I10_010967 [Lichtheimia ornata]